MPRSLVTLLILAFALLASSCSDQSALGPSQSTQAGADQQRPSFGAGRSETGKGKKGDDPTTKRGPGGSPRGWTN